MAKKTKKDIDLSKFDTSVGVKLKKIAQSYQLDILSFEPGNCLRDDWQLPFEMGLEEYRITLGKIYSLEDLENECEATSIEDFIKRWGKDHPVGSRYHAEFLEGVAKLGTIQSVDRDYKLEFSVFLPEMDSYKRTKNHDLIILAIWQLAAHYFIILRNSVDDTFDGKMLEYYSAIHHEKFGAFLELSQVQISNRNVSRVADYAYRLYKDSKFFYELKGHLGDSEYHNLIEDLSKKMKV